ncbi:hypothetical protein M378DRAFT_155900 [Amanita muscaria Koide BX008]|uniref:Uncharacterized protein n=1 Tax=Amanita muscaria (strain Koide BX008) TaxID=946122 RepID=A0A0C2XP59_AMAMK|nr:hypothetical protein M378DRAFT_155900 [Amanita muscaria Koide BX008]
MNRVQSGDMPSMAELMSDPSLRDMYVHCPLSYHLTHMIALRANQFTQGGDEQGS